MSKDTPDYCQKCLIQSGSFQSYHKRDCDCTCHTTPVESDWEDGFDERFVIAPIGIKHFIRTELAKARQDEREKTIAEIADSIPEDLLMASFPGSRYTLEYKEGYNQALNRVRDIITNLSNTNK